MAVELRLFLRLRRLLEEYFVRLVEADDPVLEVWDILVDLWDADRDVRSYFRLEEDASEFERDLNNVFFEFYDYLYRRIRSMVLEFSPPLIIVDGMSIREGNLLIRDLEKEGYDILEYSCSFSALPSNTMSFREAMNVKFTEVRSGKTPSDLDFKLPVWISYPDEILHHAAEILPPERTYEMMRDCVFKVLDMVGKGEVTLISDHGYIMVDYVWSLAKGDSRFLKEKVFGSQRFVRVDEVDNSVLRRLRELPRDRSYVLVDDNYCYVRGRYFWPIRGYGRVVAHGGLSLMECMVPKIRVRV